MKKISYYALLITVVAFAACKTQKKPVVPEVFDEFIELKAYWKKEIKRKAPLADTIISDTGVILLKLYDETPLHKANFLRLVNQKFFDSLLFHRVISGFMIQGGDPTSKNAGPHEMLGSGDAGDRIPAEFNPKLFHKKGALAAARDNNPAKASSSCQFYIVQGSGPMDTNMVNMFSERTKFAYDSAQKATYANIGGTPFLDGSYTVFGEVVRGLDVVDRIANVPTGQANRPVMDVRIMHVRVVKVPRTVKN